MRPETTLFYDVDTQRDFILPGGKLCVAGTDRIVPNLARLTRIAHERNIKVLATVDRHFPDNEELSRNGGKYPDHCMDGTPGQRKIAETEPVKPIYIENRSLTTSDVAAALAHQGELVIEKQRFDVMTGNRNSLTILESLARRYRDVVIYGVYTEVCVDYAVHAFLSLGPKLHVITDAIADIGTDPEAFRRAWAASGVELITLAELEDCLADGG